MENVHRKRDRKLREHNLAQRDRNRADRKAGKSSLDDIRFPGRGKGVSDLRTGPIPKEAREKRLKRRARQGDMFNLGKKGTVMPHSNEKYELSDQDRKDRKARRRANRFKRERRETLK